MTDRRVARGGGSCVIAAAVVVAAALAVVLATRGGSSGSTPARRPRRAAATRARRRPASTHHKHATTQSKQAKATPPAETAVVVLNGTLTTGLAHRISAQLQQTGYSQAAALSGRPPGANEVTVVEYAPGPPGRRRTGSRARCRSPTCSRSNRPSPRSPGRRRWWSSSAPTGPPRAPPRHSRLPRHPGALGQAARGRGSRT